MSAVLSMPSGMGDPADVAAAEAANRASLTASDRLALSRERLRQAMSDPSVPRGEGSNRRAGGAAVAWQDSLKSIPGARIVVDAVRSWWRQNPLRIVAMAGADAAKVIVNPMAQRNPVGLILGAFLVGGLLVWSRPWRWIVKPPLFAGLLPQLVHKAITHVPVQSWVAVLMSLVGEERAPSSTSEGPVRSVDQMSQD